MTKLDKIIALAQQDADRCGKTLLIFNLNPFSPLYVIRNFTVAGANSKELVRVITPGGVQPPTEGGVIEVTTASEMLARLGLARGQGDDA